MATIGKVESLWRYPVKSMRGEELSEAFVGFAGVYGDRLFAFRSAVRPNGFPYLTGREQMKMVLYRPRFRHPDKAAKPPNLAEAEGIEPGLSPIFADPVVLAVDVETPSGKVLSVDDPMLIRELDEGLRDRHDLTLLRSERAMTDCRPVSLFAVQTGRRLSEELGIDLDKRLLQGECFHRPRIHSRVRRGWLRWSETAHRFEDGTLDPRTRPSLRHDHNRSRHGGAQPRNSRQGHQGPRR